MSSVFGGISSTHTTLTWHSGATATTTCSAILDGVLGCVQFEITAFASTTHKKRLGILAFSRQTCTSVGASALVNKIGSIIPHQGCENCP